MSIALYVLAAWIILGCLLAVGSTGKVRKALTPAAAAFIVLIDAVIVVTLVLAARRLS